MGVRLVGAGSGMVFSRDVVPSSFVGTREVVLSVAAYARGPVATSQEVWLGSQQVRQCNCSVIFILLSRDSSILCNQCRYVEEDSKQGQGTERGQIGMI